jgi:uncharacterized membrane protein YfcA
LLSLLQAPLASPAAMALALAVVLGAGFVRGFAGFGFSAFSVAGLSLLVAPTAVIPAVFVLEIVASLHMLREGLRHADRVWLRALVMGQVIGVPVGVALLAWLPETPLRLLICGLLLVATLSLRAGLHPQLTPTPGTRLAVGTVSGVVNGVAAIGGVVVAVLLSASAMAPHVLRATMVLMLLFSDLLALLWAALLPQTGAAPLIGPDTWRWALWLAPPMMLGIWLGGLAFQRVSAAQFRQRLLDLLLVIALLSLGRTLWALR